ncbi:MAG: hypothetical protein ABR903_03905 [Thermodesulfovibrionales bacterium]|jgi:hypothetical protein
MSLLDFIGLELELEETLGRKGEMMEYSGWRFGEGEIIGEAGKAC